MKPDSLLDVTEHRRDVAGLKYVYPVVSRRAGGLSVGINLNVNNACNWACVYCQVPGLVRGAPEAIDLALLDRELRGFLAELVRGDYLRRHVPEGMRQLADIAFSGNGEPTSAREFAAAVAVAGEGMRTFDLQGKIPLRLITNGSGVARKSVAEGLLRIAELGGEVWFKLDRATAAGIRAVNQVALDPLTVARRLDRCSAMVPTWIQTCWFGIDAQPPGRDEEAAYLALVAGFRDRIQGVHLYGIARAPMQPGGERLTRLRADLLDAFAERIRERGVRVSVSP